MDRAKIQSIKEWVKRNYLYAVIVTVLLALLYGNYSHTIFSQDSYAVYLSGNISHAKLNLSSGRFIQSIFSCFINEARHQRLAYLLSIIFLAVSFCAVYFTLVKNIRSGIMKSGLFLGLLFLFANPFYCDWFEYATKLGTTFGVLLASLASLFFYKIRSSDIKKNTVRNYFALIVLLFLASGGYQASLNYFVIESALLSGKLYYEDVQNRRPRFVIRNCFMITAVYCLEGLLTYIFMTVVLPVFGISNDKISPVSISDNIREMFNNLHDLIVTNQNMMPRYCFLIVSIVLLLLFISSAAVYRDFLGVFSLLLNLLMVFVAPFSAWLVSTVWMAPRTLTVFMAIPGLILLYFIFLMNQISQDGGVCRKAINSTYLVSLAFSVFLLSVYCYKTIQISGDLIKVNTLDQNIAGTYCSQIEKYEDQTGSRITTIAFPDHNGTCFHYDNVIQTYDTNISALSPQWSRIGVMQYVSGRVFNGVPMDQKTYEKYFGTKRWNAASPEQVVCDGNTAYIAVCSP